MFISLTIATVASVSILCLMLRVDNFEGINKSSLKNVKKMFELVRSKAKEKLKGSTGGKTTVAEQHRPGHYRAIDKPEMLEKAIEEGSMEFVKNWVHTPGNHIDSRFSDGQTILHKAAFVGNANIVRLALKEGADSLGGDVEMNTPLHLACLAGNALIVKILTDRDSDPFAPNMFDETPMELCEKRGNRGCQVLLKRAIANRGSGIPEELTLRRSRLGPVDSV